METEVVVAVEKDEEDRISALPDELKAHILSFLTMEDSVSTSILSKTWRYQWIFNPNLVFSDYSNFCPPVGKCKCSVAVIHKCIQLYKPKLLQKFRVNLYTLVDVSKEIEEWINFAANKQVQNLHVSLHMHGLSVDGLSNCLHAYCKYVPFKLPDCLFSSQHLQVLKLNGGSILAHETYKCKLYPPPPSHFKCTDSLKHLSLSNIDSFEGAIHALVSQCRRLESLALVNVYGIDNLEIFLPQLLRLEISCFNLECLDIDAPNLQFLRCGGWIYGRIYISKTPLLKRVVFCDRFFQLQNFWGSTMCNNLVTENQNNPP